MTECCINGAGAQCDHANIILTNFQHQAACETYHRPFGSTITCSTDEGIPAGERRDIDNVTRLLFRHVWDNGSSAQEQTSQVCTPHPVKIVRREIGHISEHAYTGVIHEDVDSAEF